MYTVVVALFSGYLLFPLIISNILTLAVPLLPSTAKIFAQQGITFVSWLIILGFLSWRYPGRLLSYLALKPTRPARYYLWEAIQVLLVMLLMMLAMDFLVKALGGGADRPYENYSSNELKVISFFAVMIAPILEEVVFRGFVQTTFHKIVTPVRAMVFTCLLFLLFHANYFLSMQAMFYVLALGLVLGYWRERTQSILPGMVGHLFNNILASLALFSK